LAAEEMRQMEKKDMVNFPRAVVLGDGGWGTTLAILLHRKGIEVSLWGIFPDYVEFLRKERENTKYLPGVEIPRDIPIVSDIAGAIRGRNVIITAVPSHHMREICRKAAPYITDAERDATLIINGAKGIETGTFMRMSEVINQEIRSARIVVLSGPSHAEEVVRGSPTTVVVSSSSDEFSSRAQKLLMSELFRVYTNSDLIGVEIAGAIKNVIAIAAGASDGLGFGDNAKAALITRGIVEIARLGVKMGARASTFAGLAGLGDLITTCVSNYGRNRRVGEMIARGKDREEILGEMEMVAEGIRTTKAAYGMARRYGVEMPITEQVYAVLYKGKDPAVAVKELMLRSAKPEIEVL
jgi:glycerol-3-phosphate dehydrogenase (NAD(P)+)